MENDTYIADFSADLFAFGVTLGMMLLGERVCEKRITRSRTSLLPPTPQRLAQALEDAVDVGTPLSAWQLISVLTSPYSRLRGTAKDLVGHAFFTEVLKQDWVESFLGQVAPGSEATNDTSFLGQFASILQQVGFNETDTPLLEPDTSPSETSTSPPETSAPPAPQSSPPTFEAYKPSLWTRASYEDDVDEVEF